MLLYNTPLPPLSNSQSADITITEVAVTTFPLSLIWFSQPVHSWADCLIADSCRQFHDTTRFQLAPSMSVYKTRLSNLSTLTTSSLGQPVTKSSCLLQLLAGAAATWARYTQLKPVESTSAVQAATRWFGCGWQRAWSTCGCWEATGVAYWPWKQWAICCSVGDGTTLSGAEAARVVFCAAAWWKWSTLFTWINVWKWWRVWFHFWILWLQPELNSRSWFRGGGDVHVRWEWREYCRRFG